MFVRTFVVYSVLILFGCTGDAIDTHTSNHAPSAHFQKAIAAQTDRVNKSPDSTAARLKLVYLYDSAGLYAPAALHLDTLISKDSLNAGLWFARAELNESHGDTLAALYAYRKSIKIYPAQDVMLSLANLLAESGNSESLEICQYLQRLKLGREFDVHTSFISGIFYARTGNFNRAEQYFDDCIGSNHNYMEAYIEKGLLYFDRKDYTKALQIFKKASTVSSLYADAYYYQGRCYQLLQQKDSAILRFEQSLLLDKNLKEAKQALEQLK
jgi:tetratricopeptide (TPR) repeat protein